MFGREPYTDEDVPDLTGRVIIVTGCNTGLGKENVISMASKGAHVIMACRSAEKTEPVAEEIRNETGNPKVEFMKLDLQSPTSVNEFADAFLARGLPLHVLLNNAGVAWSHFSLSDFGVEVQFATNHLGPFLLTQRLLPVLQASAPSRIVVTSSLAHKYVDRVPIPSPPISDPLTDEDLRPFTDPKLYSRIRAYCASKLANVLFTQELTRRLGPDSQVYVNCNHPGSVDTDILRGVKTSRFWSVLYAPVKLFILTSKQGAINNLFLSVSPRVEQEGIRGQYFVPQLKNERPRTPTPDQGADLWTFTNALLTKVVPGYTPNI